MFPPAYSVLHNASFHQRVFSLDQIAQKSQSTGVCPNIGVGGGGDPAEQIADDADGLEKTEKAGKVKDVGLEETSVVR